MKTIVHCDLRNIKHLMNRHLHCVAAKSGPPTHSFPGLASPSLKCTVRTAFLQNTVISLIFGPPYIFRLVKPLRVQSDSPKLVTKTVPNVL